MTEETSLNYLLIEDMLELLATGANGAEYVDLPSLLQEAADEIRNLRANNDRLILRYYEVSENELPMTDDSKSVAAESKTYDLPTLQTLLARVESDNGGDRELDAEIMFDFFAVPVGRREDGGPNGYLWPEDDASWSFGRRFPGRDRAWFTEKRHSEQETLLIERDGALVLMNSLRVPRLTASLDAAVALVERVRPDLVYTICKMRANQGFYAALEDDGPFLIYELLNESRRISTPARALVAALLRAEIARCVTLRPSV